MLSNHFTSTVYSLFGSLLKLCTLSLEYLFPKPLPKIALSNPEDPYSAYGRIDLPITSHYAFQATTIPELLELSLKNLPSHRDVLGYRKVRNCSGTQLELDNEYTWLTLEQVEQTVDKLARAFHHHGVKFQERVLIYAETSPEWFLCAQALWRMGATVTTLFATLGTEGIIHGITETEVEHIITTRDLLSKLLPILEQIPKVRQVYILEERRKEKSDWLEQSHLSAVKLINYRDLLEDGKKMSKAQLQLPKAKDIAVVVYTSGSTGQPKGVIQTHGNILAACHGFYSTFGASFMENATEHTYYAFLPLAHVFELFSEIGYFGVGCRIGYGNILTMVDSSPGLCPGSGGDLSLLRPTFLSAVPLLLERIRLKLSSSKKRSLFQTVVKYKTFWRSLGMKTPLVNWLICKKAQGSLGGRLQFMIVGGAPVNAQTQEIIQNLFNIRILVGYGMTESCAGSFISDFDEPTLGTSSILHGGKYRLIDWHAGGYSVRNRSNPRGELLVGGPSISQGYFKKPQLTAESFEVDADGTRWFRTGDIVEVLAGKQITIIDRKKNLVKLANGEYVSLGKVEAILKLFPLIEHVAVFSHLQVNFLVALLSVNETAIRQLATNMPAKTSLKSLCENETIQMQVQKMFLAFCEKAGLAQVETPRHIKLCTEEWSPDNGFLTASMKISREKIRAAYQKDIQGLFEL